MISYESNSNDQQKGDYAVFEVEPPNNKQEERDHLYLFCFDISKLNHSFQFIICVGGVFLFYLLYGYYQELIFRLPGLKQHGWYLTLVQFVFYFCFACFETVAANKDLERRVPLKMYFLIAFLTVSTMGLSNASLGYLNYPTQVIFKCCKLIPVLIGGIIIQGKKYGPLDFLACVLMSIGLTFFILADSKTQPSFNYLGVFMMSGALLADAAIGNVQERTLKTFNALNTEMIMYSYGIGFFYILGFLAVSGMLTSGFYQYAERPYESYGYASLYSATGYLGIAFVLTLVRGFGALAAVTVTTCRKALTMVLSFLLFAKPFTFQYVWSGCIVLMGVLLNIYQKNRKNINSGCLCIFHKVFQRHFVAEKQYRKLNV